MKIIWFVLRGDFKSRFLLSLSHTFGLNLFFFSLSEFSHTFSSEKPEETNREASDQS